MHLSSGAVELDRRSGGNAAPFALLHFCVAEQLPRATAAVEHWRYGHQLWPCEPPQQWRDFLIFRAMRRGALTSGMWSLVQQTQPMRISSNLLPKSSNDFVDLRIIAECAEFFDLVLVILDTLFEIGFRDF